MKAEEVLRRYAAGERNFSRENLRGQSFKGKDLSGANFSEADIRGTNFTNAALQGTNFSGAKAGLSDHGVISITMVSLLLAATVGYVFPAIAEIFAVKLLSIESTESSERLLTAFPVAVVLVVLTASFLVTARKRVQLASEAVALTLASSVSLVLAVTGALAGALVAGISVAIAMAWTGSGTLNITVAAILAGALATAYGNATALIVATTGIIAGAVVGVLAAAIVFIAAVVETVMVAGTGALAAAVTGAGALTLVGSYFGWQALNEDKFFPSLTPPLTRVVAITFVATGGTCFQGADLTDANFTQATLKSTNLIGACVTRTCWLHAKNLDLARVGINYLRNPQLRQLVITKKGQEKNFDRQDLRGVNLQGAKLAYASFIGTNLNEASLRDVDLSRAMLVQTQLDETDLTGATLTGATLEDWGITSHTKLRGVRCEYVFMRVPTKEDPNPRRQPDNWAETFEDGDFADFIKPIVDTLDLYHNQGVDPRAIAISFKQLAENHPDADLEIVAMERRGQENFLLRATTAPEADHSALSAEYFEYYNRLKALPKDDLIFLLAHQDGEIQRLETAFRIMAETPKYNLNNAKFGGGFAAEGGIQTGGIFNDFSSNQNLSEAAAQIQQLLTQLRTQGYSQEDAQQQVAEELATQAKNDPTVMGKLVKWGQSLGDAAAKTTVTEAATAVVKLALSLSGIPLP